MKHENFYSKFYYGNWKLFLHNFLLSYSDANIVLVYYDNSLIASKDPLIRFSPPFCLRFRSLSSTVSILLQDFLFTIKLFHDYHEWFYWSNQKYLHKVTQLNQLTKEPVEKNKSIKVLNRDQGNMVKATSTWSVV